MGLAALVVVLLLTGASLWRFSANGSAATPQGAALELAAPQIAAPPLVSLAQEPEEGGAGESGGWPDGLSVIPEEASQVCPSTPIVAMYPLSNGATAVVL